MPPSFTYSLYRRKAGRSRGLLTRSIKWEAGELESFVVFADQPGPVAYLRINRSNGREWNVVGVDPTGDLFEPFDPRKMRRTGWHTVDAWSFEHESLAESCDQIVETVTAGDEAKALELARKVHDSITKDRSTLTEDHGFRDGQAA